MNAWLSAVVVISALTGGTDRAASDVADVPAQGEVAAPTLVFLGTPDGTMPVSLRMVQAQPFAFATLVVGLSTVSTPFANDILVPSPDVVVGGLQTNARGMLQLEGRWPDALPPGLPIYFQMVVTDDSKPTGLALSNSLSAAGQ